MSLDTTRVAVLVKRTFRHSRKDLNHWIVAFYLVHVDELEHAKTVAEEGASQESVDKENITHRVYRVE